MASDLKKRLKSPAVKLGIKQFRVVIDFLTAIEDEMERMGKSQADLARLLQKRRAWISKFFVARKRNLTFFTAVELADALGMDVEVRVSRRRGAGPVRGGRLSSRCASRHTTSRPVVSRVLARGS